MSYFQLVEDDTSSDEGTTSSGRTPSANLFFRVESISDKEQFLAKKAATGKETIGNLQGQAAAGVGADANPAKAATGKAATGKEIISKHPRKGEMRSRSRNPFASYDRT